MFGLEKILSSERRLHLGKPGLLYLGWDGVVHRIIDFNYCTERQLMDVFSLCHFLALVLL